MKKTAFVSVLLTVLLVGYICPATSAAFFEAPQGFRRVVAADPPVKVGMTAGLMTGGWVDMGVSALNSEFIQYHPAAVHMADRQIQLSLFDNGTLFEDGLTAAQQTAELNKYHVLHLMFRVDSSKNLSTLKARLIASAAVLSDWVTAGGGLVLQPISVRYADKEIYYEAWNAFLQPFGITMVNEGLYDTTRTYTGTKQKYPFWSTSNITAHSVTQGVYNLFLPLRNNIYSFPGVSLMTYSPDWQVIVKGEVEAKSYLSVLSGEYTVDTAQPGTITSEPPVVAVRQFGAGRIVCYPLGNVHTYSQYGMSFWDQVVETAGSGATVSDSMQLWENAYRWCAAPVLSNTAFGTYFQSPYAPVQYPSSVDWDPSTFEAATVADSRGIIGAHTTYTDGTGTVAQYVTAAKAAGLEFIVFTDPLESLMSGEFDSLKADCAAASKSGDFYACPGIEFFDHHGNRWVMWGEQVKYPPATAESYGKTFIQWDGQRINQFGSYAQSWNSIPNGLGLINLGDLRQRGGHLEKLYRYFTMFPFANGGNQLIADNFADYLASLRILSLNSVSSYTRTLSFSDVREAASTCFTSYKDLPTAIKSLNGTGGWYEDSLSSRRYTSQGPTIALWEAINSQMARHPRLTRGAQRVRVKFTVQSAVGIDEVKVHDADLGLYRRFNGRGAKELSEEFEAVHDRQHNLVLEVVDVNGKRAISSYLFIFCYNNGVFRMSDNLNTMGFSGWFLHFDREQMPPAMLDNRYLSDEVLHVDGGQSLYPVPIAYPKEHISFEGVGWYPNLAQGKLHDFPLASTDIVATSVMFGKLSDFASKERAISAAGWINHDVAENEYFTRTHTTFTFRDRMDWFARWGARSEKKAMADYKGSLYWNEGEIRFKRDAVLKEVPLLTLSGPFDTNLGFGGTLAVHDREMGPITVAADKTTPKNPQGQIAPGGYLTTIPYGKVHVAFYSSPENDFVYSASLQDDRVDIGLASNGVTVKAGDVMKYRYAVAVFFDKESRDILKSGVLVHTGEALNLSGGKDGYPVKMEVGEMVDGTCFFIAKAKDNEALFTIGPQQLIIDLPIKVQGLDDNGCAAVYSKTTRKWFRFVPVNENTAYFQESIDAANTMWVGNIFVCDNKSVKITAVVDGQKEGANPWVEVHNPTDKKITTMLWSPEHTPGFGGMVTTVNVASGSSVVLDLDAESRQITAR